MNTSRLKLFALILGMTLLVGHSHAQFRQEILTFYSPSLGINKNVSVCLPIDYDSQSINSYPVIYEFPAGDAVVTQGNQNCTFWDRWINEIELDPFIVVTPDGYVGYLGFWTNASSLWTNSELNGDFEDYIIQDLIPHIDANYRTIAGREGRGTFGASGGAYGSISLAMKHADVFRVALSSVGALMDLSNFYERDYAYPTVSARAQILAQTSGPPYVYSPENGFWSWAFHHLSAAFSPNLNNPPYFVDLPWDSDGNVIDSVVDRWMQHSPTVLATQIPPELDLTLTFDIATIDTQFPGYYPMTEVLLDTLDALGRPYTAWYHPCGHGTTCDTFWPKYFHAREFVKAGVLTASRPVGPLVRLPNNVKIILPTTGLGYPPLEETFYVRNEGPGSVSFSTTINHSDFTQIDPDPAVPINLLEDDSVAVTVRFTPATNGIHSAVFTLVHEYFGRRVLTLQAYVNPQFGVAVESDPEIPNVPSIESVFPNPAETRANVSFTTSPTVQTRVVVYDVMGREVSVLFDGVIPNSDKQTVVWHRGSAAAGVYFIRLETTLRSVTRPVFFR